MFEIGIVIPVYNKEKYLRRCIDSILMQSFKDYVVVLVDDGSIDKSSEICDEYQEKNHNFIVFHQENSGAATARNIGINYLLENNICNYISFIDADDMIAPLFLETLFFSARNNNVLMSACLCLDVFDANSFCPEKSLENEAIIMDSEDYWLLKNGRAVSVCHNLYHSSLLKDIRFPDGYKAEDVFFAYKPIFEAKKIAYSDKNLYYYFQNSDSTSHTSLDKFYFQAKGYCSQIEYFENNGFQRSRDIAIKNYTSHLFVNYRNLYSHLGNNAPEVKIGKKMLKNALKKYRTVLSFDPNYNLYLRNTYPRFTKLKTFISKKKNNLLFIFKNNGFKGVILKVKKKFFN